MMPKWDAATLKAALAAQCEFCERHFAGDGTEYAWCQIETIDWYHGEESEPCEAAAIRAALDGDGALTGGVICDAECAECGWAYRAAIGHTCGTE